MASLPPLAVGQLALLASLAPCPSAAPPQNSWLTPTLQARTSTAKM